MADLETKGISDTSGFSAVSSSAKNQTPLRDEDSLQGQMKYLKDVPQVLQTLEERFPFTAIIISVVGYITIAAFGQMNSLGKYGGYIFFLIITFGFYKNLYKNKEKNAEDKNSYYKVGFWVLSIFSLTCIVLLLIPFIPEIKLAYKTLDNSFVGQATSSSQKQ